MGFPGTINFIGEFLVSIGVWKTNPSILFLGSFGVILSAVYSIWFFNRIMFGPIKFYSLVSFIDIQKREFCILLPLIFLILNLGIYPILFLDIIDLSTNNYII
jgi:NADH-quinone oxidoreductase subunit M